MSIMDAVFSTVKYSMFSVNVLFSIMGAVILVVGAVIQGQYSYYHQLLDSSFFTLTGFLIATGVLIFIIAIFGCCGAIKENYIMMVTYAVLVIIIFIFEFSAGIAGYMLRSKTTDLLTTSLRSTMVDYGTNTALGSEITLLWDEVQRDFQCCGVVSSADWIPIVSNTSSQFVPMSCCATVPGAIGVTSCNVTIAYPTGCAVGFGQWASSHAVGIGIAGFVLCIFQIAVVAAACWLARKSKFEHM